MFVALLMTAGLAMAAADTPAASPNTTGTTTTTTAQAPAKTQKVCKSVKTLGSRLPVKKCQTVEEAAAEQAAAQDAVRDIQRNMAPPPQ